MISLLVRLALAILVFYYCITPCTALRSYGGQSGSYGKHDSRGYKDPGNTKTFAGTSPGFSGQKSTHSGLGLSAWGIIVLIVFMIAAGMTFYYISICYPILCKKQRKYDMIEISRV